jgi:hypothetical protein
MNKTAHLFLNDLSINLPCRNIVITAKRDIQISFVIPQVEINFTTVVQDIDLSCKKVGVIGLSASREGKHSKSSER